MKTKDYVGTIVFSSFRLSVIKISNFIFYFLDPRDPSEILGVIWVCFEPVQVLLMKSLYDYEGHNRTKGKKTII